MTPTACTPTDFLQILDDIDDFWGSDRTLHLHHPMFVHEFGDTAFVMREATRVVAYLFGFISQTRPEGYIHLVAVRGPYARRGLGRRLYAHFSDVVRGRGCHALKAITTASNRQSVAFHKTLGFALEGVARGEEVPVVADYAGPGRGRVVFRRPL